MKVLFESDQAKVELVSLLAYSFHILAIDYTYSHLFLVQIRVHGTGDHSTDGDSETWLWLIVRV